MTTTTFTPGRPLMKPLFFVPLLCIAMPLAAQAVTLPTGLSATEGSSTSPYPFGQGAGACRVQYIYAASHFAGFTGPISINSVAWRADGASVQHGGSHSAVTCR